MDERPFLADGRADGAPAEAFEDVLKHAINDSVATSG